jgi:hypothetical protein
MATEVNLVAQAEAAALAVENARQGEEAAFLMSVTDRKQLEKGTQIQNARLKSRFISLRGLTAWTNLCADSRR